MFAQRKECTGWVCGPNGYKRYYEETFTPCDGKVIVLTYNHREIRMGVNEARARWTANKADGWRSVK